MTGGPWLFNIHNLETQEMLGYYKRLHRSYTKQIKYIGQDVFIRDVAQRRVNKFVYNGKRSQEDR